MALSFSRMAGIGIDLKILCLILNYYAIMIKI